MENIKIINNNMIYQFECNNLINLLSLEDLLFDFENDCSFDDD